MVISVFPDVSQGFARYEQSRRNRLIDQQARTEQEAMRRRRAAFNQMLGQIEDPQQRLALEAGGVEGVPAFFEGQRRAQAAQQEAEAARREQIQQYGMGVATRRRQLAQQEGFNEDEFLRQAYDFGRSEYGMQMPYEQFVERARNPMAGEMPDIAGAVGEVNWQDNRGINPATGREEYFAVNPRTREVEWLGVQAPPRGSSAADAVLGILASQLAPTTGADDAEGARQASVALVRLGGSMRNIEDMADEIGPSGFAVAGAGRRIAQNIMQQVGALSGLSVGGLRDEALGIARSAEEPDQELIDSINRLYDPSLSAIGPAALALAYQAAQTVAGQTGRALSDRDLANFVRIVGDPASMFTGYWDFKSRLDALDQEALNVINAERVVAGLDPIPRSLSLRNGSVLEWVSAAPEDRAAIVDRYSDGGGTPDPSDEPRGDGGEGGTRRRQYVPGRGFVDG